MVHSPAVSEPAGRGCPPEAEQNDPPVQGPCPRVHPGHWLYSPILGQESHKAILYCSKGYFLLHLNSPNKIFGVYLHGSVHQCGSPV